MIKEISMAFEADTFSDKFYKQMAMAMMFEMELYEKYMFNCVNKGDHIEYNFILPEFAYERNDGAVLGTHVDEDYVYRCPGIQVNVLADNPKQIEKSPHVGIIHLDLKNESNEIIPISMDEFIQYWDSGVYWSDDINDDIENIIKNIPNAKEIYRDNVKAIELMLDNYEKASNT